MPKVKLPQKYSYHCCSPTFEHLSFSVEHYNAALVSSADFKFILTLSKRYLSTIS